eukprot:8479623-Lingulodinium_polyedra.AAC.1
MESASVRFASRCGGGRSTRLHHCATFAKRCTTTRSNRPSAAAAARESHVRRRGGSQIARPRIPRARQNSGARVERAGVRFASRCGSE